MVQLSATTEAAVSVAAGQETEDPDDAKKFVELPQHIMPSAAMEPDGKTEIPRIHVVVTYTFYGKEDIGQVRCDEEDVRTVYIAGTTIMFR